MDSKDTLSSSQNAAAMLDLYHVHHLNLNTKLHACLI